MATKKKVGPIAISKLTKVTALAELETMKDKIEVTLEEGVTLESLDLNELKSLVKNGREAIAAPAPGDTPPPAPGPATPATPAPLGAAVKKADSVDVVKGTAPNVRYIRTYSEEVHGEDFLAMAQEFASKKEGYGIVPSDTVKNLVLRWEAPDKDTKAMTERRKVVVVKNHTMKNEVIAEAKTLGAQILVK